MHIDEKIRVGVLRGGIGPEYNISLETGSYVLTHLPRQKYRPVDILIDRDGMWHQNGVAMEPERLIDHVDIIFNALHGVDGEDGRIQKFLEDHGIPFIGSDSLSSALTGFKHATKDRLKAIGYKTPKYAVLKGLFIQADDAERLNHIRRKAMEVFKKMPGPWIVKPILGSASTHTYLVTTFAELVSILQHLSDTFNEILVEEYVEGREVASAILEGYRNEAHYAMPIHEVTRKNIEDVEGPKALGLHRVYVVGNSLEMKQKKEIEEMTRNIHREFGMSDYSLVEYIISPTKGIQVIEVDSVPILGHGAALHTMLESIGMGESEFIDHLICRNLK